MSLAERQVILEHGKTHCFRNCQGLFQEAVGLREFPSQNDCWWRQSNARNCSCCDVRTTVSRTQLSLSIPSIFRLTMSRHFTAFSLSFGSVILSSSSSSVSPEPKADDTDVSFRSEHAAITYSKQSDQLWIDASAHCKTRLCWWRLRATTLIYGHYMHIKKESSLLGKTYPSSERAKSVSPPRAYDYPTKAVEQTWRDSPLCSRHHILSENWWTLVYLWHYYRRALTMPAASTLLLEVFIARLIYSARSHPTSRIHSTLSTKKGS